MKAQLADDKIVIAEQPEGFENSAQIGSGQHGAPLKLKARISDHTPFTGHSAEKLLHTMQTQIRTNVLKRFSIDLIKESKLPEIQKHRLTELHADLSDPDKHYQLTFRDLSLLHALDPGNFRELSITGFNETDNMLESFSAQSEHWADLPIATAVRISMSLPAIIQSVILKKGDKEITMVDGGLGSNLPVHLVNPHAPGGAKFVATRLDQEVSAEAARDNAKSLQLPFKPQNIDSRMAHKQKSAPSLSTYASLYSLLFPGGLNADPQAEYDRKNYNGANTIPVEHHKLTTTNWTPDREMTEDALRIAEVLFLERIIENGISEDGAISMVYRSAEDAVNASSVADLEAFVANGRPVPVPMPGGFHPLMLVPDAEKKAREINFRKELRAYENANAQVAFYDAAIATLALGSSA
jgi:predicted acylesterase/phospholipase RssA